VSCLIWSRELDLIFLNEKKKEWEALGVRLIDDTYKPSFTNMKKGKEAKDLPPPLVQKKTAPEKQPEVSVKKVKQQKSKSLKKKEADTQSILDKIRQEAKNEERPKPKEDNFPMHKEGEDKAKGTGGLSSRPLNPAEQALQAAVQRNFEMYNREMIRRNFPKAESIVQLRLAANGNQFEIISLNKIRPSGLDALDRSCEAAIQQAVTNETFATDIITELTREEKYVTCRP